MMLQDGDLPEFGWDGGMEGSKMRKSKVKNQNLTAGRQGLQPMTGLIQQFKLNENKNGE